MPTSSVKPVTPLATPLVALVTAPLATLLVALLAAVAPTALLAQQQVGYPPAESPYRDLQTPQRITLFGGYWAANRDPVKAAPGSGPVLGLRYEVTVGGPAQFFVRAARIGTQRNAYDPTLVGSARSLGEVAMPLWLTDLGFSFNLTGQRSWHHLVPNAGFAIGVVTGGKTTDADPYRVGTKFAFSSDFGVRYVPKTSYELRLGVNNTFYQHRYPNSYVTPTGTNPTPIVGSGVARSSYLSNLMVTAGLSVPIFR